MYSKPLATRMEDGTRETPTRVKRGAALNAAVNFSSFLQGQTGSPAVGGQGGAKAANQGGTPMEQAATQNNLGLNQMRALAALSPGNAPAAAAQKQNVAQLQVPNFGLPLNPSDLFKLLSRSAPDTETAETAVRVKSHRKATKARAEEAATRKVGDALKDLRQNTATGTSAAGSASTDTNVGALAAKFESGSKGIAAIGYDRHGGTSYGKYQISSRAGTMRKFIEFCKTEAPDIAQTLEKCGGSMNTGGRRGKMPDAWVKIAEEQPERFEEVQEKFIRASHYEPAMQAIAEKTGMAFDDMPLALQEVVFSTAVQHGPQGATRIVSRAMGQVGSSTLDPENNAPETLTKAHEKLIRRIYDNRSGQFQSSTESVRAAVKSRLRQEMSMAITMLRQEHVA